MIIGKTGDKAYLDSHVGLVPCVVTAITAKEVTVDFDDSPKTIHWSGLERNAWRGRKGECFPHSMIVPAQAVTRSARNPSRMNILGYQWEVPE